jgi:lipid II:glycine glycyltransferase (peptidoglycan interpeptide bridge formation enzyme)
MQLFELTNTNKEPYNRFVAQHPSGSFLQSWQWGNWQEQLGHTAFRFFIKEGDEILLSAQVIKITVPRLKKYYLYIPYGPLINSRDEVRGVRGENSFDFFVEELKKKFPDAIFIRIESKQALATDHYSLITTPHIQPGKTLVMDLSKTPEELLAGMHPKTRYNIKVAQKHGVKVIAEPIITPGYGLYLQEVLNVLVSTASRQGFKSHKPIYYKNLIDFLGMQMQGQSCRMEIYRAVLNQQLLAAAIMIDFGQTRTYLFGGTTETQKNVMAPYALHWQAMQDAKASNLLKYDFWGIETAKGETPGFVRFKLGFGGETESFPEAKDLILNKKWYTIYTTFRYINKKLT